MFSFLCFNFISIHYHTQKQIKEKQKLTEIKKLRTTLFYTLFLYSRLDQTTFTFNSVVIMITDLTYRGFRISSMKTLLVLVVTHIHYTSIHVHIVRVKPSMFLASFIGFWFYRRYKVGDGRWACSKTAEVWVMSWPVHLDSFTWTPGFPREICDSLA